MTTQILSLLTHQVAAGQRPSNISKHLQFASLNIATVEKKMRCKVNSLSLLVAILEHTESVAWAITIAFELWLITAVVSVHLAFAQEFELLALEFQFLMANIFQPH